MKSIRARLTYANVVSTLALFLVLAGATAVGAVKLAKNSVGTKQLKKNAVTSAKLKNGAVTSAKLGRGVVAADQLADGAVSSGKLADGAVIGAKLASGAVFGDKLADGVVTSGKLADGSVSAGKLTAGAVLGDKLADHAVTGDKIVDGAVSTDKIRNGAVTLEKLDPGIPFVGVVDRIRATATLEFPAAIAEPIPYPLDNPTYTQRAGENNLYIASAQVHFPAGCGPVSRSATANLLIDAGRNVFPDERVGSATYSERGAEDRTVTVQFAPFELGHGAMTAAPASPTPHTFSIQLDSASCSGNGSSAGGIKMTGAQIDVIGIR